MFPFVMRLNPEQKLGFLQTSKLLRNHKASKQLFSETAFCLPQLIMQQGWKRKKNETGVSLSSVK